MIYLLLCILSSGAISLLFKLTERYGVRVFHIVVLNYFVAASAGFLLSEQEINFATIPQQPWAFMALLIGILFIMMFLFMGKVTREVGVSVTTVAAKMSVVVPMLFSIFYYTESLSWTKGVGMLLAVVAVVLTVFKDSKTEIDPKHIYFPIIIFLGTGIIDSLIKYTQGEYLTSDTSSVFSGTLFTVAAIAGVIASIVRRERLSGFLEPKTFFFGILLGAVNFGSLYFIIMALDSNVFDSSIVFGLNNVGVVLVSVVGALLLFAEKLSWINWIGVASSVIAIGVLASL